MRRGKIRPYSRGRLSEHLGEKETELAEAIEEEDEARILQADENRYVDRLVDEYQFDLLEIHTDTDEIQVQQEEQEVPQDRRRGFNVPRSRTPKRPVLRFWVPIEGDWTLLNYRPSTFSSAPPGKLFYADGRISFEVVSPDDQLSGVEEKRDRMLSKLDTLVGRINEDLENFNEKVQVKAPKLFEQRKEQLRERRERLHELGNPVREEDEEIDTYSVPPPKRKTIEVAETDPPESSGPPEPTLPHDAYEEILEVIHGLGKNFERTPSAHEDKGEEEIRDELLPSLEAVFEGSATGETFNNAGKTDILLRHDNENVFVAECAIWRGQERYRGKIDQLLGNLTWRDSKAALIVFVRNEAVDPVLDRIAEATSDHEMFLAKEGRPEESWFRFRLRLEADENREAHVSVLVFHFASS